MFKCTDFWHKCVFLYLLGSSVTVALTSTVIGLLTLIESRSDADPYVPVIRVVVGVLELVVVMAAVVAMFCGGFGLRVGGTRLILAYVLLHVGIVVFQVAFSSVYIGFTYTPSLIPLDRENLLKMYISSTDITEMERIQLDEECCGVYIYTDWRYTPWYDDNEGSSLLAPPSCCAVDDVIVNCTASAGNIFSKSCIQSVLDVINVSTLRVSISNAVLVVVQVPAIVLGVQLYCTLVKHSRYDVL